MKRYLIILTFTLLCIPSYCQVSPLKIGEEIFNANPSISFVREVLENNGFSKDYEKISKTVACSFCSQYFIGSTDKPALIVYVEKDCENNSVELRFVFDAMGEYHKQVIEYLSQNNYDVVDTHIYSDGNSMEKYSYADNVTLQIWSFPQKEKIRVDMIRHYSVWD